MKFVPVKSTDRRLVRRKGAKRANRVKPIARVQIARLITFLGV